MNKWILFCLVLIISCTKEGEDEFVVEGLKPVYGTMETLVIKSSDVRPYGNLGQIVYRAPIILINEVRAGIHVIDITNPDLPKKVSFIEIPGINSFNLKGNFLYAKSGSALIVIDISDYRDTKLTSITSIFDVSDDINFPENYAGYFECYDPNGGLIIGWEEAELINPKCRR